VGFLFLTSNCKNTKSSKPFSAVLTNDCCISAYWVSWSRRWQRGLRGSLRGAAGAALHRHSWFQLPLPGTQLSPSAKMAAPLGTSVEERPKTLRRQRSRRRASRRSSHWSRFLAAPGGAHTGAGRHVLTGEPGLEQVQPEGLHTRGEDSRWNAPGRSSRKGLSWTNHKPPSPGLLQGGGRGVRNEGISLSLGRSWGCGV